MPGAAVATFRDLRRDALQMTLAAGRFAPVSKVLNVGYTSAGTDAILRVSP